MRRVLAFKDFLGPRVWQYFLVSIAIGLMWFLVELSFIFVLQGFLLEIGLLENSKVFLPDWYPRGIIASVGCLFLFGLARAIAYGLKSYVAGMTQQEFICNQRIRILETSFRNPTKRSVTEVVSLFTETITHGGVVVYYITQLIVVAISALFFVLYCAKLAPYEMVIAGTSLAIVFFPQKWFSSRIGASGRGLTVDWKRINDALVVGLRNIFFLRVYGLVEKEISKAKNGLLSYKGHYRSYLAISGLLSGFPLFIGIVVIGIVAILSVQYFGTEPMKLVAFFYLFVRLAQAASEGNQTVSYIKLHTPGFRLLRELSLASSEVVERETIGQSRVESSGELILEMKDVSFSYAQRTFLKNVTHTVRRGERFVIKGPSGVGKSTVLALVMGLIRPLTGKVTLNAVDVDAVQNLHELLGYVGPEPYMIQGTIRENLLYGTTNLNPTDDQLREVLKFVLLDGLVDSFSKGLDESIFELAQISTGQKQRLAIARAILRSPEILVLDEATANIDEKTELLILKNLRNKFIRSIVIVVTHKSTFDSWATKILEMKNED